MSIEHDASAMQTDNDITYSPLTHLVKKALKNQDEFVKSHDPNRVLWGITGTEPRL